LTVRLTAGSLLLAQPFLPAAVGYEPLRLAVGYALLRLTSVYGRWVWLGAGWDACLALLVFVPTVALTIAGGPLAVLGAWLAERSLEVVETPRRRTAVLTWVVIGLAIPVVSGALDLHLRQHRL
jgi:hypothetical protein